MIVQSSTLDSRKAYHLLASCIVPRPVAWVTTLSPDGTVNAAPYSFFNAIAPDPPTIMISVNRQEGRLKNTSNNIFARREFVVHIINEELARNIKIISAPYPATEVEILDAGLSLQPSETIKPPRIPECPVQLECVLIHSMEIGSGPTDVLFGEVRVFHVDERVLTNGRIDPARLRAIGRLSGNAYCRTTEMFEMGKTL